MLAQKAACPPSSSIACAVPCVTPPAGGACGSAARGVCSCGPPLRPCPSPSSSRWRPCRWGLQERGWRQAWQLAPILLELLACSDPAWSCWLPHVVQSLLALNSVTGWLSTVPVSVGCAERWCPSCAWAMLPHPFFLQCSHRPPAPLPARSSTPWSPPSCRAWHSSSS